MKDAVGAAHGGRRGRWVGGVLLVVALAALYGRVLRFEFLGWDDTIHVTRNPHLRLESVGRFWCGPYEWLYVPVAYTYWTALAELSESAVTGADGGPSPAVFHAGSLVLHLGASALVYGFLVGWTGRAPPALLGAALFGAHPLQVESVAWVSEARGLLAALLGLGALLALARGSAEASGAASGGRAALLRWGLPSVLVALALLSKPSAVSLPLVALVVAAAHPSVRGGRDLRPLVPWFALALLAVLVNKAQQPTEAIEATTPVALRPLVAADALTFYLAKLVAPVGLAIDYGRTPSAVWAGGPARLAVAVATVLALATACARWRALRAPAALFVAGLLPVLGLVPFFFQRISTVADRYAYLALLGPALGLALLARRGRGWAVAAAVAVGLAAARAHDQLATWRSDETLFARALAVNPASWVAHYNLGVRGVEVGRLAEAEAGFRAALEVRPDHVPSRVALATVLAATDRLDEARAQLERATERAPGDAGAHYNLGVVHAMAHRDRAAEAALRRAVACDPQHVGAHHQLGNVLERRGRLEEARRWQERALALEPGSAAARAALERLARRGR